MIDTHAVDPAGLPVRLADARKSESQRRNAPQMDSHTVPGSLAVKKLALRERISWRCLEA